MKQAIIENGRVVNVIIGDIGGVNCPDNVGIGFLYDDNEFFPPASEPVLTWNSPNLSPEYHYIDIGPFMDRFGMKALSVVSSTDNTVKGIVTLLMPRKYVDLKRVDVAQMVDILVAKGLINNDDKAIILNPITTEAERHIKNLPQPLEE